MTAVATDRKPFTARLPIEIDTAGQATPVRLNLIAVVHADAPHVTGLIIDMTRVEVVRAVQLRALRTMREHADELGIALCVAAPLESVRRLLHLADIAERTPVFPSISAALGACAQPTETPDSRPGERARRPVNLGTPDRTHS
jgi:anti-anti-sigma regulatory factor